jgi:H+/Cl- antiporter ClcA
MSSTKDKSIRIDELNIYQANYILCRGLCRCANKTLIFYLLFFCTSNIYSFFYFKPFDPFLICLLLAIFTAIFSKCFFEALVIIKKLDKVALRIEFLENQ